MCMDFWTRWVMPQPERDGGGHLVSHRLQLRPPCTCVHLSIYFQESSTSALIAAIGCRPAARAGGAEG